MLIHACLKSSVASLTKGLVITAPILLLITAQSLAEVHAPDAMLNHLKPTCQQGQEVRHHRLINRNPVSDLLMSLRWMCASAVL